MKKAKMKHKAKRPFKLDFSSQGETHKELFTLELDANDIYEWEVGDSVPEIGHSIMQLEFYGLDFATGGDLLLGTVLFDSCNWGLEINKVVSNAWYEATHPWLDYEDAVKKKAFENKKTNEFERDILLKEDIDNNMFIHSASYITRNNIHGLAFKPLKPFEYAYFDNVEVWQK